MAAIGRRVGAIAGFIFAALALSRSPSDAVFLDQEGTIKLGVRTYVDTRIGTENTHNGMLLQVPGDGTISSSATFPESAAGHMRQLRSFVEAELNQELDPLVKRGLGPFALLDDLPFKIKDLAYHLTFRGEADGVYDWGPREYSTAIQFRELAAADPPNPLVQNCLQPDPEHPNKCLVPLTFGQAFQQVPAARRKLRHLGVDRERLFQAYVEGNLGKLFVRFGRQILSWGETDGFQLLDNINPLDNSFGGFLISLDERRVPLDMLRAQYPIGNFGPFSEAYLEGYGAIDNRVGYYPGIPAGSPWALPSLGAPSNDSKDFLIRPARTFDDARGGVRFVFNVLDATFSLAHYYTYFDTEALQVVTNPFVRGSQTQRGLLSAFNDGLACPVLDPTTGLLVPNNNDTTCGTPAHVFHTAPKVQVSGASTTFALPQIYSVFRSEFAYFRNEPSFTQGQLDPFIFNLTDGKTTGGRETRSSLNAVVGMDVNQWIRFLNPDQTFFISTQFFYKHILDAAGSDIFVTNKAGKTIINPDRQVLPITQNLTTFDSPFVTVPNLEPIFIQQPANQYLQTLFISTSYRSGTINPALTIFYDWGGSFAYIPEVVFSHDPFRFAIDYSILSAHTYKGGSGVSLLKDRDNVQFRFEYVI